MESTKKIPDVQSALDAVFPDADKLEMAIFSDKLRSGIVLEGSERPLLTEYGRGIASAIAEKEYRLFLQGFSYRQILEAEEILMSTKWDGVCLRVKQIFEGAIAQAFRVEMAVAEGKKASQQSLASTLGDRGVPFADVLKAVNETLQPPEAALATHVEEAVLMVKGDHDRARAAVLGEAPQFFDE